MPSQTKSVPQDVPATLLPLSLQTDDPVEQAVMPLLQRFVGWHAVPVVHETHEPVRQTRFVPQGAPSPSVVPESLHIGVPDVHASLPPWQGLVGVQPEPSTQPMHEPPEQT